ncbi:MAG: hypothetical protein CM1200mP30_14550 [Pseudomonadota bacterium]|nr:MAG: hypothetical protein CM1200mP30_14550 [Pseudomonadota bacterium]
MKKQIIIKKPGTQGRSPETYANQLSYFFARGYTGKGTKMRKEYRRLWTETVVKRV